MPRTYQVTVTKIEYKDTQDGSNKYMVATLLGDKGKEHTANIFDPAIKADIKTALEQKKILTINMEKNDKNFWDIVSSSVTDQAANTQKSSSGPKAGAPEEQMTKDDWDKKDLMKMYELS